MTSIIKKNMVFCKSCTSIKEKCTRGNQCNFAHKINDVDPDPCPHGDGCVTRWREVKMCGYRHDFESNEDYATRVGFVERVKTIKTFGPLNALEIARITVDKLEKFGPINPDGNVGANIMKKWGWVEGLGLGKNMDGILLPIKPLALSKRSVKLSKIISGINTPVIFAKTKTKIKIKVKKQSTKYKNKKKKTSVGDLCNDFSSKLTL